MPWDSASYSAQFPLAPLGGLFVATIGAFILLGCIVPRARMTVTYIGFGISTLALVLGGRLAVGLPRPSRIQVESLILAIVLEVIAFVLVMPRARPHGERAVTIATLGIVGAHFLVMAPAFGPLIAALGLLCAANAAIAWKQASYSSGAAWLADGALKLAFGALLIATSPLVYARAH